jgi:potassium inwardly-rectifying channel subfamily J protein 1
MIRQRRTKEGEIIPHQIYDMELTHLRNGQLFFPRPTIVEHIIDSRSPLHGIQRSTFDKEHFEIIAIIEGAFDYTGFACHFRTSYLPNELLWGYQFASCDSTLEGFDYEKFNQARLIDVRSIWIYDEEENNDRTMPNTPSNSPSFVHNHFGRRNSDKRAQQQQQQPNSIDDLITSNPYKHITTIDLTDDEQ